MTYIERFRYKQVMYKIAIARRMRVSGTISLQASFILFDAKVALWSLELSIKIMQRKKANMLIENKNNP